MQKKNAEGKIFKCDICKSRVFIPKSQLHPRKALVFDTENNKPAKEYLYAGGLTVRLCGKLVVCGLCNSETVTHVFEGWPKLIKNWMRW